MAEEVAGGITVRDVSADKFIAALADSFKNNDKFVVPKWVDIVKTGVHKELAPYDPDWYYIRAGNSFACVISHRYFIFVIFSSAAVARKVYLKQGTGVGELRRKFGGSYRFVIDILLILHLQAYLMSLRFCRRGAQPNKHQDSAGGLLRSILITLDEIKITEKCEKGGRKVSRVGQQALDLVAGQVSRGEV
jgi:small subunit ribosomal protein S19e